MSERYGSALSGQLWFNQSYSSTESGAGSLGHPEVAYARAADKTFCRISALKYTCSPDWRADLAVDAFGYR
jgi:hypothetical protein